MGRGGVRSNRWVACGSPSAPNGAKVYSYRARAERGARKKKKGEIISGSIAFEKKEQRSQKEKKRALRRGEMPL